MVISEAVAAAQQGKYIRRQAWRPSAFVHYDKTLDLLLWNADDQYVATPQDLLTTDWEAWSPPALSAVPALPSYDDPVAVNFFLDATAELDDHGGDGPRDDEYVVCFLRALNAWYKSSDHVWHSIRTDEPREATEVCLRCGAQIAPLIPCGHCVDDGDL